MEECGAILFHRKVEMDGTPRSHQVQASAVSGPNKPMPSMTVVQTMVFKTKTNKTLPIREFHNLLWKHSPELNLSIKYFPNI